MTLFYKICNNITFEYELWEYGIECCLYNLKDELISSAHVSHISPELDKVNEIGRRDLSIFCFSV